MLNDITRINVMANIDIKGVHCVLMVASIVGGFCYCFHDALEHGTTFGEAM